MKKLFTLMAIFVLILAACGDGDTSDNNNNNNNNNVSGNNADVIGTWTGNYSNNWSNGTVKFDIAESTWVLVINDKDFGMQSINGTWMRNGNTLTLSSNNGIFGTASLAGNTLILSIGDGYDTDTFQLTKTDSPVTGGTSLKIQNESSFEITDVKWSNVLFTQGAESIQNGSYVTKSVQEGSGYVYFKRKTNPINVRTDQPVVIEKNEQKVFVINDNTLVVDVDNPTNKGTLGSLQPVITSLKIQNESSFEITDVKWSNVLFTQGAESIQNGSYVTKNVQEGSGYLYFYRNTDDPISARTDQPIVIEKSEQKVFVINDNTLVVDVDNAANKGTFGTLGIKREPQITVQAGDTPIAQFGNYDFGSVLLNTSKDVEFTIGNSGKADLKFNVVEGNVVNLSNNASGLFSVNQQPFATMTIAPGSTTTFVIRFSPKTVGSNFNVGVTIATNSENNAEFTFRVRGDGSNEYKIGDTGPGGGMIFYAQGGQYKECSGELGSYNWTDANNQANNQMGGSFTNWRLPDIGELDLMYRNLKAKNLGGFSNAYYWSSTETSNGHLYMDFSNGSQNSYYGGPSNIHRVRAVRAFSL